MSELSCSRFFCDKRGGRFCCAFCPDPCGNPCLNHPDRCNLAEHKKPRRRAHKHSHPPEVRARIVQLIKERNLTTAQIALKCEVPECTVSWYRAKLKRELESNEGAEK